MAIYFASNAVELHAALDRASGGDIIELAGGDYGEFFRRDDVFSSDVSIVAASANNPPVFDSINLWECSHLSFDGITVDFTPDMDTLETHSAFRAASSSNITVKNSLLDGGVAVGGVDPSVDPGQQGNQGINGFPVGRGFNFHQTDGVTLENNEVTSFTTGALFSGVDGITMVGNDIHHTRKTPVNGSDVSNVVMTDNSFSDVTPWKFGGLGDHGDFIHFWTTPHQTEPSENFLFANNFFNQGDGVAILGIYLDDNRNDMGFRNVTITENVMHNGNAQGLRLEDVVGAQITNNTFIQSPGDDPRDAPSFFLSDGTRDIWIDGNLFPGVTGYTQVEMAANNIRLGDNQTIQIHEPLADNYAGSLITNPLTTDATLADLRAIPGSAAEGYGAAITQFGADGSMVPVYISSTTGEGLNMNAKTLTLASGANGQIDPSFAGATVTWDFGNGHTASGVTVSHVYDLPDLYQVSATVTLPDGTVHLIERSLNVMTPVPLAEYFEDERATQLGLEDAYDLIGTVSTEATDMGQSLRVGDRSAVKIEATDALLGNPEFTLSLGFRKDQGHEDDGGRIFYYSGTAVIDVTGSSLTLRAKTEEGTSLTLRAFDLNITDSDWHQITYTFSEETGEAILYLDGAEVARAEGLSGGQYTTPGHAMYLGNPFGAGFEGVLDNALFLRAALDPAEVAEKYDAFQRGEVTEYAAEAPPPAAIYPEAQQQTVEEVEVVQPSVIEEVMSFETTDLIDLGSTGVGARIEREMIADLPGAEAFDISFSMSADQPGASGEVFRLHGSVLVEVQSDGNLQVRTFASDGDMVRMKTTDAPFADMESHDVTLSLRGETLTLDVDGVQIQTAEMDASLGDKGSHDLLFGNPWDRKNFDGTLERFEVTTFDGNGDIATTRMLDTVDVAYMPGDADGMAPSSFLFSVISTAPDAMIGDNALVLRADDGMETVSTMIDRFDTDTDNSAALPDV